ncbi:MAG TPA: hypothetical protein VG122_18225 [Gemmata sp.]|jgi:hypothetical protein|nr:hypothetical protein [Gemmata sp.]
MFFLFSGEGPTDMGSGLSPGQISEGEQFQHGPMAAIVDQIVETQWGYSILHTDGSVGFVSEGALAAEAGDLKATKKSIRLPGPKTPKETRFFFNSARLLARIAKHLGNERTIDVIAILFRDSDGTGSADRGLWDDKQQSMLDGFAEEGFMTGVPMVPKPKSEAWLLCALKANPYQSCAKLEDRSGNDKSPKALKKELAKLVPGEVTRELLLNLVTTRTVDIDRIDMPSFSTFRTRLEEVL